MLTNMQKNILKVSLILLCGFLQAADYGSTGVSRCERSDEIILVGTQLYQQKNYIGALAYFENAMQNPELHRWYHDVVLAFIGEIHAKELPGKPRDFQKALHSFDRALSLNTLKVETLKYVYTHKAHIYSVGDAHVQRDGNVAIDMLEKALSLPWPSTCANLRWCGSLYNDLGKIYQNGQGINLDPELANTYFKRAQKLFEEADSKDVQQDEFEAVERLLGLSAIGNEQAASTSDADTSTCNRSRNYRKRIEQSESVATRGSNKSARRFNRSTPSAQSKPLERYSAEQSETEEEAD